MGYISNKTFKIINAIIWGFALIGMVVLIDAYFELKEIQSDIKRIQQKNDRIIDRK